MSDNNSFYDLGVSTVFSTYLETLGYTNPTSVQQKTIPSILMGHDVIAIAETGSGKTAAFSVPMLEILANSSSKARMPRALILEPTRELASQVNDAITTYAKHQQLESMMMIGGVSMDGQSQQLEKSIDVIIATPGRFMDHVQKGSILLHQIEYLVIDEGDRMLDMGFIPDIRYILSLLPSKRQTVFFSATMAPEIEALTSEFMKAPKHIKVAKPATTAKTITQYKTICSFMQKRHVVRKFLDDENVDYAIIFCNNKRTVHELEQSLKRHNYKSASLHGDLNQHERLRVLDAFRQQDISILVCSDVAARGLDIPHVNFVINFDIPHYAEDYVHRIGRTGRAGKHGVALNIATTKDATYIEAIEQLIGQEIALYETPAESNEQAKPQKKSKHTPRNTPIERERNNQKNADDGGMSSPVMDDIPAFLQQSVLAASNE